MEKLSVMGKVQSMNSISLKQSNRVFKFGSGQTYCSKGCVLIPACIGEKWVNIQTDVIDLNLPLLLSKKAMKNANTKLDFNADYVEMLGEKIPLQYTTSGHYMIPLLQISDCSSLQDVLLSITTDNWAENAKAIKKLHVEFGHAGAKRLIDLLKDAGYSDQRLFKVVKDVALNCNTCKVYKKVDSRPVVGFAWEKISMMLSVWI